MKYSAKSGNTFHSANETRRFIHVCSNMFTLATIDGIHNNSQTNRYKPKYLCLCMLLPSRSAKLIYSSVNAHVNIPISLKTFKHFISLLKKCNDLREKKLTAFT